MAESLTPTQAMHAISELRDQRDTANQRVAGLALMIWSLIVTSAAGSLVALGFVLMYKLSAAQWALYIFGNVLVVVAWFTVGTVIQRALWQTFPGNPLRIERKRIAWAAGIAIMIVPTAAWMQGLTRYLAKLADPGADGMYNLGVAMAFHIGAGLILCIALLMSGAVRMRPAFVAAGAMFGVGHLTRFAWVPELGIAGAVVAVVLIPLSLLSIGYVLWRRG